MKSWIQFPACACVVLVLCWISIGQPRLVTQLGHSGPVKSAIFSPDGKLVASAGAGGIIIWHASTGRELRRIAGFFSAIDFAPNGRSLAAVEATDDFSDEGEQLEETPFIVIFDVPDGRLIKRFPAGRRKINSIKFSRFGRLVLTAGDDKTAKLWNVATGRLKLSFTGHESPVNCATFSPDEKLIATSGTAGYSSDKREFRNDLTARIWNATTGKELKRFSHQDESRRMADGFVQFSPDGQFLVTSVNPPIATIERFKIRVWHWKTGQQLYSFVGKGPASFSPDGKYILVGITEKLNAKHDQDDPEDWDGLALIEFGSGKIASRFADHATTSLTGSLSFSPDNKYVLVATETIYSGGTGIGDYGENSLRMYEALTAKEVYTLGRDVRQIKQLSLSRNEKNVLAGNYLWNLEKGSPVALHNFDLNKLDEGFNDSLPVRIFSKDGSIVGESIYLENDGEFQHGIQLWDVDTGQEMRKISTDLTAAYIPTGNQFLIAESDGSVCSWRISDGKNLWCVDTSDDYSRAAVGSLEQDYGYCAISADERTIFIRNRINSLIAVDISTGQQIWKTSIQMFPHPGTFLSANNKYVIVPTESRPTNNDSFLSFVSTKSGKEVFKVKAGPYWVTDIKSMLVVEQYPKREYVFVNKDTAKVFGRLSHRIGRPSALSGDLRRVLTVDANIIRLCDLRSGKVLRTFKGHNSDISQARFFDNDQLVISSSLDGTTRIWDATSGIELCSLISFDDGTWVTTTPEGRFDTNNLDSTVGLHWVVTDQPLSPLPIQVFMRDYYEPNLLARVLRCKNACQQEFRPVRDLSKLNRMQPKVGIKEIKRTNTPDVVEVRIEAENASSEFQKDLDGKFLDSGLFDLRLFRDGQMVGHSTSDDNLLNTFKAYKDFDEELAAWREASEVELIDGKRTFTFNVKLPVGPTMEQVEFSAYAFNKDRVRSESTRVSYTIPDDAKLKSESRKAYIVAVGVSKYDDPKWDLRFAGYDARAISETVAANLRAQKDFSEAVEIRLISDTEIVDNQLMEKRDATKGNIQTVLELLAGKTPSAERMRFLERAVGSDVLQRILPSKPDDMVLIAFSSHGYANKNGVFYIVPSDIGQHSTKKVTGDLLSRSISSDELSLWLRDVDAGELVMILDACHSAAAVEGGDFKPGPMGSRGLGQLAFDKGMRILAATQSDNVALESKSIKQGLLTYALIKDGIESGKADYNPKDNITYVSEWLSYGVGRVPALYEELFVTTQPNFSNVTGTPVGVVIPSQYSKSASKTLEEIIVNSRTQQPSLFDFTRNRRQVALAVKL